MIPNVRQNSEFQITAIIMILTGGIFLFDITTPRGVAAGGLYVAVILLALKLRKAQSILLLAIVCSLLTILGYFLKPPGGIHWMALTNRTLAIFAIWVTAILSFQRKQVEEMLKKLPQQILHFQDVEDKRVAEEIHEDMAQSIVAVKLSIQSIFSEPVSKNQTLNNAKTGIFEQLNRVIEKARQLAYGLYPSSVYTLGLTAAIKSLVDRYNKQNNLDIKLFIEPFEHIVKKDVAIHFYRIVQEALSNIDEHAQAHSAEIKIKVEKNNLRLIIKDNGKGFVYQESPYGAGISTHGLGLTMMSERAKLLKGKFSVTSSLGKGAMIELLMPCNTER